VVAGGGAHAAAPQGWLDAACSADDVTGSLESRTGIRLGLIAPLLHME
jgi:hypothetical protein